MRGVKPTVKAFVRRLELMINHIGKEGSQAVCPGRRGFVANKCIAKSANAGLLPNMSWCHTCQDFMGIAYFYMDKKCPCYFYMDKRKDPIKEALKRIQAWRETNA